MNPQSLPGPLKVAILIQSLGKDMSDQLRLKFDNIVQERIKIHLMQVGDVSPELAESVAKEFTSIGFAAASNPEKMPVPRAATKQKEP